MGDLNTAHEDIHVTRSRMGPDLAAATPEERENFEKLLNIGFTDAFICLHPYTTNAYTFRAHGSNSKRRKEGWRLDYFLIGNELKHYIKSVEHRPDVDFSDHCPIVVKKGLKLANSHTPSHIKYQLFTKQGLE